MVLTVNHLIELFKEIPVGISYDYVSGNGNKARLVSIDEGGKRIQMERISRDGSVDKTTYLNPDNLNTLANKIKENTPITIDFALGNNGNTRSVFEAILIRTSEFYKCVINNSKHMVWIPSKKHNAGELHEIKQEDIPDHNQILEQASYLNFYNSPNKDKFLPYLTALRTKPFMLLAGISGTGKSRIVRELAKACWQEGDEDYGKNHPRNFCMVQVKPNWHDSSELIGYAPLFHHLLKQHSQSV